MVFSVLIVLALLGAGILALSEYSRLGASGLGCSIAMLLVAVLSLAVRRDLGNIAIRDHVKLKPFLEIVDSRDDPVLSMLLRVMLEDRITKVNSEIVWAKKYADGIFDIWVVDELAELEPLP